MIPTNAIDARALARFARTQESDAKARRRPLEARAWGEEAHALDNEAMALEQGSEPFCWDRDHLEVY